MSLCIFFFFQAEDGIRDLTVTGVQTCALPISYRMLSVGMTEAEVLGRAGLPQTTLIGSAYAFGSPYPFWPIFGANRFVYSSGDWIVEITFGGGRVVSINQTRLRP